MACRPPRSNKLYHMEPPQSHCARPGHGLIAGIMDNEREQGSKFLPKFDAAGLLAAIVTDAGDGAVLMLGYMNQSAYDATRATGLVHFYSRSRDRLWQKGESSGNVLRVEDIHIDCDQDALLIIASPAGPTCHTGERSCFYRRVAEDGSLQRL